MNNYTRFLVVFAAECLSSLGANVLSFALGVWVYQQSGSAAQFGVVVFCAVVPQVLLAPALGVLVDRLSRRRVMVVCNFGASLCGAALFVLSQRGWLVLPDICVLTLLASSFTCAHQLAYAASVTLLLPDEKQRAKANGLIQLGLAGAFVIAPMLGGAMLARIGLSSVMLADCAGFAIATLSLALLRMPELALAPQASARSLGGDFRDGLRHIRGHRGLLALLTIAAASNFSVGFVQVLFTPMVLLVASQQTLGVLLSVGGAGMALGGIACAIRGVPRRPIRGICAGLAGGGACMILGAQHAAVALWGICVFMYFVSIPLINASLQSIWQAQVPPALQGRVFAVRSTVSYTCLPLAYLLSPWLAANWFEPWMADNGALASSLGRWLGTGPGRGMALMFLLAGAGLIVMALIAAANRTLTQDLSAPTHVTSGHTELVGERSAS